MTKNEIEIITLLQRQGIGYRRIAALTSLPVDTVKSYCKRHPVDSTETVPAAEGFCKQCGRPINHTANRRAKVYCSDKCRMAWWNSHRDQVNRASARTVICGYCGTAFEAFGEPNRKYCSIACSQASRRKVVEA